MTDTFLTDASPAIKRDRFGRYLLPDPDTGKDRAWTRVTTFADTLDDRYNLERWKIRQALVGVAARPDLLMSVASADPGDKATLDRLADDAMAAAASDKGANLGTALHRFTEAVDRGQTPRVPAPFDADIAAYTATLAASPFTVAPGMIERVVCLPDFGLCGTFDRLLVGANGNYVGDVKTGQVDYAMGSIAVQLACYAHAPWVWDGVSWDAMPAVDIDRAVVIHLPAGTGTCRLVEVDIAAGWEAAEHAAWVRGWRKRRNLHRELPAAPAPSAAPTPYTPPLTPRRAAWVRPDEGGPCDPAAVTAMRATVAALADADRARFRRWVEDAHAEGRRVKLADSPETVRWLELARAMLAALAHDDEFLRHILAAVMGDDGALQESVHVGVALASLTIEEARRLTDALDLGTAPVIDDDGHWRLAA